MVTRAPRSTDLSGKILIRAATVAPASTVERSPTTASSCSTTSRLIIARAHTIAPWTCAWKPTYAPSHTTARSRFAPSSTITLSPTAVIGPTRAFAFTRTLRPRHTGATISAVGSIVVFAPTHTPAERSTPGTARSTRPLSRSSCASRYCASEPTSAQYPSIT